MPPGCYHFFSSRIPAWVLLWRYKTKGDHWEAATELSLAAAGTNIFKRSQSKYKSKSDSLLAWVHACFRMNEKQMGFKMNEHPNILQLYQGLYPTPERLIYGHV